MQNAIRITNGGTGRIDHQGMTSSSTFMVKKIRILLRTMKTIPARI